MMELFRQWRRSRLLPGLIILAAVVSAHATVPDLQALECALHRLAIRFARARVPTLSTSHESAIAAALRLGELCNSTITAPADQAATVERFGPDVVADGDLTVFVATDGDDLAAGTKSAPFRTLVRARDFLRAARQGNSSATANVYIRGGKYFLNETLELSEEDSYTTWAAYNGEQVVLSGGVPLRGLEWKPYTEDILVADVRVPLDREYAAALRGAPSYGGTGPLDGSKHEWGPPPAKFNALFVDGQRQIQARYPNGDPEAKSGLCFSKADHADEECRGWAEAGGAYGDSLPSSTTVAKVTMGPIRGSSPTLGCPQCTTGFQTYHHTVYQPPEGHPVYNQPVLWANNSYLSFWSDLLTRPGGILAGANFSGSSHWAHPETGLLHMFHPGLWGGWQYRLVARTKDVKSGQEALSFGYGGYQEARGGGVKKGQHYYVANVFEELDAPGEWFFDAPEQKLYYYPPHGQSLNLSTEVVAATLETVIRVRGAVHAAQSVTFSGLVITETRTTFLDLHEVPSGGDWSVHRGGSLVVENAERLRITKCTFEQVGGNAVVLSNHVWGSTIDGNTFHRTGDSGVVSLGSVEWIYGLKESFPRDNIVARNIFYDVGIFGKQTSCYFQALTARATLQDNICFNGPRAGINFNDGFFGGHSVSGNLIFNQVRETGDHGPFNSWDRQPYITKNGVDDGFSPEERGAPNGTSIIAQPSFIRNNFIMNGYSGVWTIDHDDGSQRFNDTENLMVFGGCKNFLGNSKSCDHNLIIYPGIDVRSVGGRRCQSDDNHVFANQYFHGNDCITEDGATYSFRACTNVTLNTTVFQTWNNTFYTPNASFLGPCIGVSGFEQWLELGQDIGSTVRPTPSIDEILSMAEAKLDLVSRPSDLLFI